MQNRFKVIWETIRGFQINFDTSKTFDGTENINLEYSSQLAGVLLSLSDSFLRTNFMFLSKTIRFLLSFYNLILEDRESMALFINSNSKHLI